MNEDLEGNNEDTGFLQSISRDTHSENFQLNQIDSPLDERRTASSQLKDYLKADKRHEFIEEYASRYNRPFRPDGASDLFRFIQSLDDDCLSRAVGYWKEEDIFVIHDLLCNVDRLNGQDATEFLEFLKDRSNLSIDYGKDTHRRTWLHAVVSIDCNTDIIKFVKEDLNVSPYCQDDMGNTVLHDFCMHTTDGNANHNKAKDIISLLIGGNMDLLLIENKNEQTPLEIACGRKFVFNTLMKLVKLDDLWKHVDLLGNSFASIERADVPPKQDVASFWIDIFRKNDKSKMLAYMKDVEGFNKMYLMEDERTFKGTFTKCANNNVLRNEITEKIKKITNRNEELSEYFKLPGVRNCRFYGSAPFLALLTGRWDLVMPLIAFSPLEVVPFCLLTCTVCDKMKRWGNISDTVHHELIQLHKTADAYLTEIIKSMHQQYPRNANSDVVYEYLTKPTNFFNKSLMDVSYFANSRKLFDSLVCRKMIRRLWKKTHCTSICKFVFHSLFHIVFLLCLFFVMIKDSRNQIGGVEIFCYLYGVGYFAEEVRQMIYYRRMEHWTHYFRDVTNIVDLIGLVYLLVAFGFRCLTSFSSDSIGHMEWQHKMAFIGYLFLCLTSIFMSIRLLYFLSYFEKFGPMLKMIEKMIFKDLIPFVVIFFVFIVSFGVSFQSLSFSDVSINSSSSSERISNLVPDILWRQTLTIFEPKFVIEEATESKSPSIHDPMMRLIIQFLLIMFIIIVSVMLMNMLIAMFSQTVSDVSLTAKESWAIDQWKLVREYEVKSHLVPPLNVIEIVVVSIKWLCEHFVCKSATNEDEKTAYVHPFTILLLLRIDKFELLKNLETSGIEDDTVKMMNFLLNKIEKLDDKMEKQDDKLEKLDDKMEKQDDKLEKLDDKIEKQDDKLEKLDDKIEKLDNKMKKLEEMPDNIKALKKGISSQNSNQSVDMTL